MKLHHLIAAGVAALALSAGFAPEASAQSHDHGHGTPGHVHDHGKAIDLGTTTVAGLKMNIRQLGDVTVGGQGVFDFAFPKQFEKPKMMRVWIGNAEAKGAVKTRIKFDGSENDVHVEIAKDPPMGSKLWVEIEPAKGGKKVKVPFDLQR